MSHHRTHRIGKLVWIPFMILLFLASCNRNVTVPTTQDAVETKTPTPSITITPTKPTQTPSPSPTHLLPTQTPSPTSGYAIPYQITPYDYVYETATPVATPDQPASNYRLKEWTEQEGLNLIRRMDDYSRANHTMGAGRSRYDYVLAQWSARLASLEFLARFKNSPFENDVRWRLAFANSWLINPESDAWVIRQIEDGFNLGIIRMDNLETVLNPYGFVIDAQVTEPADENYGCWPGGASDPLYVSGLFTMNAQILVIRPIEQGVGLVVALTQDADGHYQVIPIRSGRIYMAMGACQITKAQDLTGDGVPEIMIEEMAASGSMQTIDLYIYQWREDQFVEITNGGIETMPMEIPSLVEITTEPNGSKAIHVQEQGPGVIEETVTWKWDGAEFYPADNQVHFPLTSENIYNGAIGAALSNGQFAEIEKQLAGKDVPEGLEEFVGPAAKDYLAFKRAMGKVFSFQSGQARGLLQSLIRAPAHPDLTAIPESAQQFLDVYKADMDLYRACLATHLFYQNLFFTEQEKQVNSGLNQAFPSGFWSPQDLCNPRTAFSVLIRKLSQTHHQDLPAELESYGVDIVYKESFDVNSDRKPDWILVPSHHGRANDYDVWFVISSSNGYQTASWRYLHSDENKPIFQTHLIQLPGEPNPSFIMDISDDVLAVRFQTLNNRLSFRETWVSFFSVASYEMIQAGDTFLIDLRLKPEYMDRFYPFHVLAQWDPIEEEFITRDYYEETLLMGTQPKKSTEDILEVLNQILPQIEDGYNKKQEEPRYRYLLGLSYELAGDRENASSVYYELWRAFPDQPYGMMAKEKLQVVTP